MNRLRRPLAVLLALLLLQVTGLGAGAGCALTTPLAPVPGVVGHAEEHEAHGQAHHHAPPRSAPGHGGQQAPLHCAMAASCAIVALAAVDPALGTTSSLVTAAIVVHDDDLPASLGQAPEPPPPRA